MFEWLKNIVRAKNSINENKSAKDNKDEISNTLMIKDEELALKVYEAKREKFVAQIHMTNISYENLSEEYKKDYIVLAELLRLKKDVFVYLDDETSLKLINFLIKQNLFKPHFRRGINKSLKGNEEFNKIMLLNDNDYYQEMPDVYKKQESFVEIFMKAGGDYDLLDPIYKTKREYILNYLSKDINNYAKIDPSFKYDLQVIALFLEKNYKNRKEIDFSKMEEKDFKILIKSNPDLYENASIDMKNNKGVTLEVLKRNPKMIAFIGKDLSDDTDVFSINGLSNDFLKYSKENGMVRNEMLIVKNAVKKNVSNYQYIGDRWKNDKDLYLELLRDDFSMYSKTILYSNVGSKVLEKKYIRDEIIKDGYISLIYKRLPDEVKNNVECIKKWLKNEPSLFYLLSDEIKIIEDVVKVIFKTKYASSAFDAFNDNIRYSKEFLFKYRNEIINLRFHKPNSFQKEYDAILSYDRKEVLENKIKSLDIDKSNDKAFRRNKV